MISNVTVNAPQFDTSLCRVGSVVRFIKAGITSRQMVSPYGLLLAVTPLLLTVIFVHKDKAENSDGGNIFNVAIEEVISEKIQFEVLPWE